MPTCRIYADVDYKASATDPESIASAMDKLMETATSTPGILEDYGDPEIGEFFVAPEYPMVKISTGYGSDPRANPEVEVARFGGGFLRGPDGDCAFCKGDPCNEYSQPDSVIAKFYEVAKNAETCPVCQGRPS